MYHYYYEIDESVLADIQEYEDQQLLRFKNEFDCLCLSISSLYSWNYTVSGCRWIDTTDKWHSKHFDGYTATLQVDFTDSNGNLIEVDENICSFFENITFISFNPILQKYKVFQNEMLVDIRKEIECFVQSLKQSGEDKTGDGTMS